MNSLSKKDRFFPSPLFSDFFSKEFFDWNNKQFAHFGSTLPSVNVQETDTDLKIELAAPGLKREDFNINLHHNVLTVSSEQKEEKEEKDAKGNYVRREFNYQSFSRSFTLPESANQDKVDAKYSDGILHITIAKKALPNGHASKNIEVK